MSTPGQPPDTPSGQPIPGVRYRTETRERMVPETVNGVTRMVPETYYVSVPVPPRDWDRILLRAVTAAAVVITAVSVAWTTAGIGALLAPVVPAPVAYGAAGVFDMAWLCCQAVEWLERYDPPRAKLARRAGWAALALAVTAVVAHGISTHNPVAGSVGAAVSVIAKGLWVVVLQHYAVPLGQRVGGWLLLRRREVAAQRALAAEVRRMNAEDAYARAVYGDAPATGAEVAEDPTALRAPAQSPDPAPANVTPITQQPSIADTIRACRANGMTELPDIIAHVRQVHGDRKGLHDTVARTLRRIEHREAQ